MITIDDFKANTKEWLIDNLANMSLKEASQTISDLYDELHKPKYPKTYIECCGVIGFCSASLDWNNPFCINKGTHPYIKMLDILMESFCKLLICRDAYWKIAGKEMGLDKPWKPEFGKYIHYNISFYLFKDSFQLYKGKYMDSDNRILVFPTEEIRDMFYENFKDLIEECKELL